MRGNWLIILIQSGSRQEKKSLQFSYNILVKYVNKQPSTLQKNSLGIMSSLRIIRPCLLTKTSLLKFINIRNVTDHAIDHNFKLIRVLWNPTPNTSLGNSLLYISERIKGLVTSSLLYTGLLLLFFWKLLMKTSLKSSERINIRQTCIYQ